MYNEVENNLESSSSFIFVWSGEGAYRLKVMIGAERVPRRRLKGSHGGDWWWELGIGPNSLT